MKPSVAIYCSRNTLGAFDEDSLEQGVGGSETNAILFARELGLSGNEVRVINDVEVPTQFGNVWYMPKKDISLYADANVWIVWRNPDAVKDLKDKEGRKVLWLHDLIPEVEVIRYMELYDLIWVQSTFHRNFYPSIPDEKFMVQPSGIGHVEAKAERDPNLHVYTSNYDRGLDVLLEIWPNYLFKFPDSKLVVAYGYQTMEALAEMADKREKKGDLHKRQWEYRRENLEQRMALKGVTHVGKLNKRELAELYERASILAYPSTFPEVQCMTVTEAADHGCIPVTSSLAALQETNSMGFALPPAVDFTSNAYARLLIGARENVTEATRESAKDIARAYYWDRLAPEIMRRILEA